MELNELTVKEEGLGKLLGGKSPSTIQSMFYRNPAALPPPIRLPGMKGPVWIVADVLAWMRKHQVPEGTSYKAPGKDRAAKARAVQARRGRPGQAEQIEADRLGISVPELRELRVVEGQQ